jgi:Glycosyltransferase family 87
MFTRRTPLLEPIIKKTRMNLNKKSHWLNLERLHIYPKLIFGALVLCCAGIFLYLKLNGDHFYYENDFSIFWTVSRLALEGKTILAYDYLYLLDQVREIAPVIKSRWFYLPTYDLFVLPLALLPYGVSFFVFMTTTFICYSATLWRILPYKETLWWCASFGGAWINLRFGQNGFVTATLVGAALINLNTRPTLAGMFIGLLTMKPHLAVLFPVALIAAKAWRTLISATITSIVFLCISTYIIGVDSLLASIASISQARELIENNESVGFWQIMPTFFSFSRLLGLSVLTSYLLHYFISLIATISTWLAWRRMSNSALRNAIFITSTLLISPYLHIYDLTWLALAIAWFVKYGLDNGWQNWERGMLIVAWALPFIDVPISRYLFIQIGPIVILLFLIIMMKRWVHLPPNCELKA